MSGVNNLNRSCDIVNYDNKLFKNLAKANLDEVFIADDSEWDTSKHSNNDINYRTQEDIISHQYVIKYKNYPAKGIIIYRNTSDKPFCLNDMLSAVRFYLNKVGYNEDYDKYDFQRLSKQLGIKKEKIEKKLAKSKRVPPITWVGFFGGVDITAYCDWKKYLDIQGNSKTDPNFIALNKQEFFSKQYSIMITNLNSRRIKYPISIQFVDTMALGPQGGLAALGAIVGQRKLNTKQWDLQDDLITYRQYTNPHDPGYYKQHMRYLRDQRPNDYRAYALGDSEVTLKYLDFFMSNVIHVHNEGLINHIHIPVTLTSFADEISSHFSHLPYDSQTVDDIYNGIFQGINVNRFLRPLVYNQQPPKNHNEWIRVLNKAVSSSDNFEFQKIFMNKLKPYLSHGSIAYLISKDGNVYQRLIGSASIDKNNGNIIKLVNQIDYNGLYHDNPNFDITNLKYQKITVSKPKFNISTKLRNQYADHAHQFNLTRNNVAPTIDDLLLKMYNDSIFSQVMKPGDHCIIPWSPKAFLAKELNFDGMRKGYIFTEPSGNDKKHKKGSHDQFSVRPDSVYNNGFLMAKHAYVGGMNIAFNPGVIINAFKYKYDIDLKSSYVNAGLLIPDFRLDCNPILDTHDFNINLLKDYLHHPKFFPSGPFTIGVANVSYHFPDNIKRVPVGYKPPIKGQGPVYVRQANRVDMTLTDVINIIEHNGVVRIHRIIIPQQKTLDGTVNCLAPIGKMQHWSLIKRNEAKANRSKYNDNSDEYRKYDSLQLFYKLLGNGGYGKSGQGLGTGGTRDFLTDMTMYVPFSRNTNPFTAAQYTSIARYQVNKLMDLVEYLYPNSLIPSVTTDGFIFCSNNILNEETVRTACEKHFNQYWIMVNKNNFNNQYFELKSHNHKQKVTTEPLVNIRTRFNFTLDNHIKALVGLRPTNWSTKRLEKMLINDIVTFKVDDLRMQSLNDMKHSIDNKRYISLKTWHQPKWLNLNPDDTYQPIGFVPQGEFGYYLTQPFASVEDLIAYRHDLKNYRSIFPTFRKNYGEAFMQLNQSVRNYYHGKQTEKHVAWVKNDPYLIGSNYPEILDNYHSTYVPTVMLRYLANHQDEYDFKEIYKRLFSERYKRYSSFRQAIKRNKNKFVNPLCLLKENIVSALKEDNHY